MSRILPFYITNNFTTLAKIAVPRLGFTCTIKILHFSCVFLPKIFSIFYVRRSETEVASYALCRNIHNSVLDSQSKVETWRGTGFFDVCISYIHIFTEIYGNTYSYIIHVHSHNIITIYACARASFRKRVHGNARGGPHKRGLSFIHKSTASIYSPADK